jgi:hypothetical protein
LNDKNATLGWRFFCPIETHIYRQPWLALQVFKRGQALACSKNAFNAPSDGVFGVGCHCSGFIPVLASSTK